MIIGTYIDGRPLDYNEDFYQFSVGGTPVSLTDVKAYDGAGQIAWSMPEQRDWLYSLNEEVFSRAHLKVVAEHASQNGPVHPYASEATQVPYVAGVSQGQPKKTKTSTIVILLIIIVVLFCALIGVSSCSVLYLAASADSSSGTLYEEYCDSYGIDDSSSYDYDYDNSASDASYGGTTGF